MSPSIKITLIICVAIWLIATEKIISDYILTDKAGDFLRQSLKHHYLIPSPKDGDSADTKL